MMESAPDGAGVVGIVVVQTMYMMFGIVFPLMVLILLGGLWMVPLTLEEQRLLMYIASSASAWDGLVTLVLSAVAAVAQIGQLAQYMVKKNTGNLCTVAEAPLQQIFPETPSNQKCFDVISNFEPTAAVIITGNIIGLIVQECTFKLARAALLDRELAMKRKMPINPSDMKGCSGFLVRKSLETFAKIENSKDRLKNLQELAKLELEQQASMAGMQDPTQQQYDPNMMMNQQQQMTPSMMMNNGGYDPYQQQQQQMQYGGARVVSSNIDV
jgi:hypothetical protein